MKSTSNSLFSEDFSVSVLSSTADDIFSISDHTDTDNSDSNSNYSDSDEEDEFEKNSSSDDDDVPSLISVTSDDEFEPVDDSMEVLVKDLKEKLALSQKENDNIREKLDKFEKSSASKRTSSLSLDFYKRNVVGERVLHGNADDCLPKVWDNIQGNLHEPFYIGASSSPEDRMKVHQQSYDKMEVLYCTTSMEEACRSLIHSSQR